MKPPMHRPSDTKRQIVRTAGDLFHARGLRSTTTEDIVEAAGITKAEFQQHFKSKPELAGTVLRHYFEGLAAGIGPVRFEIDSWGDLQECLRSHLEFQKKFKMTRSCPIGTLGGELEDGDDLTRQALTLILDLMLARLESFFSREKIAGRLAPNADVEQMANLCVVVIQGAMLVGRMARDCRRVELVFEDLLSHMKRYAKAPAGPRKRPGANRDPERPSTLAKSPPLARVMKPCDASNLEDCPEDRHPDHLSF